MAKAAEEWLRRYLGMAPIDRSDATPDRGFDLVLPKDGSTVDVKWQRSNPGARFGKEGIGYPTLNLPTWKRHPAEIFVMVVGEAIDDFDRYSWAHGWAYAEELARAPLVQGKYGRPYHALGFDYLRAIEWLR